jgi:hypothetical protein
MSSFFMLTLGPTLMCMYMCKCVSVCVKQIYKSCTHVSNKQHQCSGLVRHVTMLFVRMQKLLRGTYSYFTMITEAERSTKTVLQFCPTT